MLTNNPVNSDARARAMLCKGPRARAGYLSGVERGRYDAESRDQPLLWYRHPAVKTAIGPHPLTGNEPWK